MLYQIRDGSISAGGNVILSHFDFEIKGNEKIAVVGRNGAGKTTLLRLIAGELELDRDDRRNGPGIMKSRQVTVGMLRQQVFSDPERTVEEELLAGCPARGTFERERFEYEQEYDRLFTGFGFSKADKKRRLGSFSGGEQTRIGFIRLLLEKPDILLLDEPTNHLDVAACEWLEEYLRHYEHAVIMVSHDRFFLDRVADVVYEAGNHTLVRYVGNYTHYREEKRKRAALQQKAYERQQEEIARLNDVVEKFKHKPNKAAFARAKKKQMERMEQVEKPIADDVHIFTGEIQPELIGSKIVLNAEHLRIGYKDSGVLLELSLRIRRGQKIGLIGPNGAGKSTFLKTAAGLLPPLPGDPLNLGKSGLTLGNQITIGYFDQHSAEIQSEKSVVEHFHDQFPYMTEKEVRSVLGAYLFSGKDAARQVSDLSGGEKARLVLAELLQCRPNFLILDEPTNHMDIQAKETLESAFRAYTGTILFVSHDRYFIRQVAESVMSFEDHQAFYYPFGYEHYLDRVRRTQNEMPLAAQIRAEDQALIEGMRAVPKAERHRLREIPTEEAYLDWKLRLICEKMLPAAERYAELEEQCRRAEEEWRTSEAYWMPENALDDENQSDRQLPQNQNLLLTTLYETREQAFRLWHEFCLEYWDTYEGDGIPHL
jgi:ATP-binding cassette subfamily F protein 3